jgi:hypothetical protein
MKPQFLVLLSGVLTLGFGYWLAEESRDAREIWVSMGAWILGFWFASSILGLAKSDGDTQDRDSVSEDEEPDDEEEEAEEDDEEEEYDDEHEDR